MVSGYSSSTGLDLKLVTAPTGGTKCKYCNTPIQRGASRIDTFYPENKITNYAHPNCFRKNLLNVAKRLSKVIRSTLDA